MFSTTSMTYAELKQRVAARAALIEQDADTGREVADTTQPAQGRLEEAVADGIREFMRANSWSFSTFPCSVVMSTDGTGAMNLAGDANRYRLPDYVQSLPRPRCIWRSADNTMGGRVKIRPIDDVAEMIARDPLATGIPEYIGVEFNPMLSPEMTRPGGFELMVFPKPDQAHTLRFRAKLGTVPFVDENQVGRWPAVHDLTIVAFAVHELFKRDRDADDPGQSRTIAKAEKDRNEALAVSIERDNEDFRPQELGSMTEDRDLLGSSVIQLTDLETNTVILRRVVAA